jgi:RNA 2',3'-cyclic 3'-phosphodiesterase
MRVFAALAVPAAVCAGIVSAFSRARSLAPKVKWVAAESMHLTLHFFGEIPDAEVEGFAPVFTDPGLQRPPIRAQLGKAGFFPPSGAPKVLWVGLQRGTEEMRSFFAALTEKLQPLRAGGPLRQWSPDARGFSPHITVARPGAAPLSSHWAEEAEVPAEEFLVSECVLFQSLLGPAGARYVPLQKITFNGAGT